MLIVLFLPKGLLVQVDPFEFVLSDEEEETAASHTTRDQANRVRHVELMIHTSGLIYYLPFLLGRIQHQIVMIYLKNF